MNTRQAGFSLMEVMMAMAIIAIMLAIAIVTFNDYSIRTRVAEGLTLVTIAKTAVEETFISQNAIANQAATGFVSPPATDNVSNIAIGGGGTITVTYTAVAGGGTLTFVPTLATAAPVTWNCTGGTVLPKHRPDACR